MNDTVISDNAVVADSFIDDTIDVDVSELQIDQFDTETGPSSPQTQALEALGWVKYTTDSGDPYFYNLQEQTTQWTVPEDVLEREAELISTGKYGQGPASTTTMGTRRHAKR